MSSSSNKSKNSINNIISLLESDDDEEESDLWNSGPAFSKAAAAASVTASSSATATMSASESTAAPLEATLTLFGSCQVKVNGLQHYRGRAVKGEIVELIREPQNVRTCVREHLIE